MKQTTIDFIESNDELKKFVNKIHAMHNMLGNSAIRNMFFASLISADYLTDKKRCCGSLDELDFLSKYLNMITTDTALKKETAEFIVTASKIVKKELRRMVRMEKKNASR